MPLCIYTAGYSQSYLRTGDGLKCSHFGLKLKGLPNVVIHMQFVQQIKGEVLRLQQDADILVHAEAMDLKNRLTVRQSFSTKIVDYLKAARPILAVGPKDVASVKYLTDYNCAIVADNEKELYEKLSAAIDDKRQLHEYAAQAYMCGRMNHDKKQQEAVLKRDLCKLKEM